MKKILISVVIFIVSAILIAEKMPERKITDLEQKLQSVSGIEKIDTLNKLAYIYHSRSPEKCIEYSNQALKLSKKINYPKGEANALRNASLGYQTLGKRKETMDHLQMALGIFESIADKKGMANAVTDLGAIYLQKARYNEALEHFLRALNIAEAINDKKIIANSLNNVGIVYFYLGNFKKSLEYYLRSLQLELQLENKKGMSVSMMNIGMIYHKLENFDSALDYYDRALKICQELKNKEDSATVLTQIGLIYSELKAYKKSEQFNLESLKIAEEIGWKHQISISASNLGEAYMAQKKYDQALTYFFKSLKTSKEIDQKDVIKECYHYLSELYLAQGDYKTALEYFQKYSDIKDNIFNEKSSKQIAEMQVKYDTLKKEKEIALLKEENKIKDITRNAFIVGFFLVIIILILLFRKYLYLFTFWKKKTYISHYKVMNKIASGGMATIYKAHDIKNKSKEYAIKVLREEFFSDETYKKRFKNEAIIVDQLNHPNIVKVVERGEYEDSLYITMELLKGKTLYEMLKEKEKLELPLILNIMTQVTDALAKIHQKNIIHRDLKPENIMIIKTEENPYFVKILDFGLAQTQSLSRLTRTGIVVGTIFYLSPEQVSNSELTSASDIYSLGVIFYQMVCGQMPFFTNTALDVAIQILEKNPIEPKKLRKKFPSELNNLIKRMLDKNPTKRPSAQHLFQFLSEFKI